MQIQEPVSKSEKFALHEIANLSQDNQVEHLFRHEYGKLVALLVSRFGIEHIDAVEDAVQWSMAQAIESWRKKAVPQNPSAWLFKVSFNHLTSQLRTSKHQEKLLTKQSVFDESYSTVQEDIPLSGEMSDSLLKMLFIACSDSIPHESQLVFTLKSLCGFSIREIALRLFITEANTYKRFNRARQKLKNQATKLELIDDAEMVNRLPSIQHILYLLFSEGYLSSHEEKAIRQDLCEEAIRLTRLLTESKIGGTPESLALLSLMHLHLARISTRQDSYGALLLLEQQDRTLWNQQQIAIGLNYLQQSTNSKTISRYHIEAGIAAEHCLATTFKQTRWEKIVASYELLEKVAPSPLHWLNKAIALAEWKGPKAGLEILQSANIPAWLDCSYHWYTVQADLYFRNGENLPGKKCAEQAIKLAPSKKIKQVLINRLQEK